VTCYCKPSSGQHNACGIGLHRFKPRVRPASGRRAMPDRLSAGAPGGLFVKSLEVLDEAGGVGRGLN